MEDEFAPLVGLGSHYFRLNWRAEMDVKGVRQRFWHDQGWLHVFYMHAFSIVCSRLLISQSLVTTALGKYFPLL
jgi:hypothetical protein